MAHLIASEDLGQVGDMRVMAMEFTYSDTTAQSFPAIPANCIIDRMALDVETAFNSGTTDKLEVGDATDPNGFSPNTETDLTTTGYQTIAGAGAYGVPIRTTAATTIQLLYTSTGTAPTTGKARLYIHYYRADAVGA